MKKKKRMQEERPHQGGIFFYLFKQLILNHALDYV